MNHKLRPEGKENTEYSGYWRVGEGIRHDGSHPPEGLCENEHHGQLTGVVGVVEPGLMREVPRVVAARETHNAVPCFSPHPQKTQAYAHT